MLQRCFEAYGKWTHAAAVCFSASFCFNVASHKAWNARKINSVSELHNHVEAYENFHRTYIVLILPRFHLLQVKSLQCMHSKLWSWKMPVLRSEYQRNHKGYINASLWAAGEQYMSKTIAQFTYHRKASISYEFTVRSHNSDLGIQVKCRGCNVWHFLQVFQLVTNWSWVIYSKWSVKLVTKDQISDQGWSLNAFGYYLHQFLYYS